MTREERAERSRRAGTAEQWNRKCPPGTPVRYTSGEGKHLTTRTRSHAWSLGGGDPVVLIEGKAGGVPLWALEVL